MGDITYVWIENLSWKELITRYDRPKTFFYCDPPYYRCPDYTCNLDLEDFVDMAKFLSRIQGKFMLSIDDHPDIREVFKKICQKEVPFFIYGWAAASGGG